MGRRRQRGIETIASTPWPMGVLLGLLGYLALRYGMGWYLGATGNPLLSGLGMLAASGIYSPLGWVLLAGCWIAAVDSFIRRRRRRKLLDKQTGIESLREMNWRQFEQLTGEAFRRQGYSVEETGLGGADGGIDLILRKDGRTALVQCKQWRDQRVDVKIVREMFGILVHEGADAVKIVALGRYTADAYHFARGKPIELIHGGELIATVRSLQTSRRGPPGPMNSPFALVGSMVTSLLLIATLSSLSKLAPPPAFPKPSFVQTKFRAATAPMQQLASPPKPQPSAVIYLSNSRNDAQLRAWKKKNAEAMKILDKTTKDMPLR